MRTIRKPLIAFTLLAAAVFTTGYVVGQIGGASNSSAAGSGSNQPGAATSQTKHTDGQVTAVNGNTITIKPDGNNPNELESVTTIVLTNSTKYVTDPRSGSASTTKPTIAVGSFVMAEGTLSSDGKTLTASRFSVGGHGGGFGGPGRFGGPHADGTVTAINGNTITIKPDGNNSNEWESATTVILTSSTQYDAGHDSSAAASKSSIKVGSFVIVEGTRSSDGKTVTASRVSIRSSAPPGNGTAPAFNRGSWFNGPARFNGPFDGQNGGNV